MLYNMLQDLNVINRFVVSVGKNTLGDAGREEKEAERDRRV